MQSGLLHRMGLHEEWALTKSEFIDCTQSRLFGLT